VKTYSKTIAEFIIRPSTSVGGFFVFSRASCYTSRMTKRIICNVFLSSLIMSLLAGIPYVASAAAKAPAPTIIVHSRSSWQKTKVKTSRGTFDVQIVSADLTNPALRIATLTNTTVDCKNNCPVAPLMKYVQRVQGFAGMNGTYFCPSTYASCRGQTGSYFWMVYNSVRHVFINIHQNKFNLGPLVAFDTENHWHFYREAKTWPGLAAFEQQYETKLTALISSAPALVVDKKVVVTASELDTKQRTAKGPRGGIGFKGTNIYFVIASSATVLDLGAVMGTLGMDMAINLDGGGSSALVFDGQYRIGPGRNIPNAIVLTEHPLQ
jgi:hypothetical protein